MNTIGEREKTTLGHTCPLLNTGKMCDTLDWDFESFRGTYLSKKEVSHKLCNFLIMRLYKNQSMKETDLFVDKSRHMKNQSRVLILINEDTTVSSMFFFFNHKLPEKTLSGMAVLLKWNTRTHHAPPIDSLPYPSLIKGSSVCFFTFLHISSSHSRSNQHLAISIQTMSRSITLLFPCYCRFCHKPRICSRRNHLIIA